jgi:hypothetical protein
MDRPPDERVSVLDRLSDSAELSAVESGPWLNRAFNRSEHVRLGLHRGDCRVFVGRDGEDRLSLILDDADGGSASGGFRWVLRDHGAIVMITSTDARVLVVGIVADQVTAVRVGDVYATLGSNVFLAESRCCRGSGVRQPSASGFQPGTCAHRPDASAAPHWQICVRESPVVKVVCSRSRASPISTSGTRQASPEGACSGTPTESARRDGPPPELDADREPSRRDAHGQGVADRDQAFAGGVQVTAPNARPVVIRKRMVRSPIGSRASCGKAVQIGSRRHERVDGTPLRSTALGGLNEGRGGRRRRSRRVLRGPARTGGK